MPPVRGQVEFMRLHENCSKVQNAADFLGGSGMGKLKVITLPESLS